MNSIDLGRDSLAGLVAAGFGILGGARWATKATYAAVGWPAMLGASVAGMAIVMHVTEDSAAAVANTVAFTSFALIALGVSAAVYRPLFRWNRDFNGSQVRAWLVDALVGAVAGGLVAAIAAVNLVIYAGIEGGYEASIAEVFRESVVLGVVTVALLVAGPVIGVIVARRRRNGHPAVWSG